MKASKYLTFFIFICLFLWSGLFFSVLSGQIPQSTVIILVAKLVYLPHILILLPLLTIYKKLKDNLAIKRWFIVISVGLLLNDISWYFITYFHFNITNISLIPFIVDLIPFFTWVVASIVFSIKLLNKYVLEFKRRIYTLLMLLIVDVVVILLFLSSIHYASGLNSLTTLLQILTFVAQVVVFDFVILCLIYTENIGLSLFLSGVVILIAGDFFIIYSTISKTKDLYVYGELLWFLGLLFNMFGAFIIEGKNQYDIKSWVRADNGIKSKLILWCFNVAIISFLLFFILAYLFSIIDKAQFLGLPLFIMIYSIIVIILFSYVGKYFEEPFKQIENNISALLLDNNSTQVNNSFSTNEFMFLQKFILSAFEDKVEKDKVQFVLKEQERFRKIVGQMLHDIQSPLSGLDTLIETSSKELSEETRVSMRHAVASIGDMTKNMLSGYNKTTDTENITEQVAVLVSMALLQILSAKRFEYQKDTNIEFKTDFDKSGDFSFIRINAGDFARMISNLINNAVDAVRAKAEGVIEIGLSATKSTLIITIDDNGSGMPKHIQELFLQGKAVSEGKETGHGLGLTQVWDALKKYNGQVKVLASEQNGTYIVIKFPIIPTPSWLATSIKITIDDLIVIVDDDKSIHAAWDGKFKDIIEKSPSIKIRHFEQGQEAITFLQNLSQEQKQNTLLLTDYELIAQDLNGLEIIANSQINRAILVTSHASKAEMQKQIIQAGIRGLPKELVSLIPIVVDKKLIPGSRKVDIVWVDDRLDFIKPLIAGYYKDLLIDTYTNPRTFMEEVIQYPKDTRIILDSNYYDEVNDDPFAGFDGLGMARRLHELSFTKLILFAGVKEGELTIPSYLKFVSKYDMEAKKTLHLI